MQTQETPVPEIITPDEPPLPLHDKIINLMREFEEQLQPRRHELAKVNAFIETKRGHELTLSSGSFSMKVEGLLRTEIIAALKDKAREIQSEINTLAATTKEALNSL